MQFKSRNKRILFSVGLSVFVAGLLTIAGIYLLENYGIALFVLTPMLLGAMPILVFGYGGNPVTYKDSWQMGYLALLIFSIALIMFAIEGLMCIAMAAPIAVALTGSGAIIGYLIVKKSNSNAGKAIVLLIFVIPATAFVEKDSKPELTAVISSVEINASPQKVWDNLIEFPKLSEPTEFIFKTGIAYPIEANIEGTGVGAVRHCIFTTGSFVEPITIWEEPHLLKFDVLEQPEPMKELSFWDIDAPHLHDFFVSKQGQFRLYELEDGKTRLEGTTWYYLNIKPAFYWKSWSDFIIHKIHNRVLQHIKMNAEKE